MTHKKTFQFLSAILVFFIVAGSVFAQDPIKVTKKGIKYIVDPKKIVSGGPGKDGIPPIDNPIFVTVKQANKWLKDYEEVIAIVHNNVKKVYPLQIMVWHEIVNDIIGKDPVLITYCPLCASALAFYGKVNGEPVKFGTSGKLYNSNLVMYDRKTETYWSQILGVGIFGELSGKKLVSIPIDIVEWGKWKKYHPDSLVLSRETGYERPYGRDPYKTYYNKSFLMFPVEHTDNSVFSKSAIYGIKVNGLYKAYLKCDIINKSPIFDEVKGVKIKIEYLNDGRVRFTNIETGNEIYHERMFWFAWYAFHPGTKLFGR